MFANTKLAKKIWFVPTIIAVIAVVIGVIVNLANDYYMDYSYSYYYYYSSATFDWGMFIGDIVGRFGSLIGVALVGINAKLNWGVDKTDDNQTI